jgi:hypothetical protein
MVRDRPDGHADRVHTRSDDQVAVEVQQVARSLDGAILSEGRVHHVYAFRDDLIIRIDVEEIAPTTESRRSAEG